MQIIVSCWWSLLSSNKRKRAKTKIDAPGNNRALSVVARLTDLRARMPWLMALCLLVLGFTLAYKGEKMPDKEGFATSDGVVYASWVRSPDRLFKLNSYQSHRILPAVIVRQSMKSLGIPFQSDRIVLAFACFNALLLSLAGYMWGRLSLHCQWSTTAAWCGFVGLFLNYAAMKVPFYTPVMTDTSAFTLGMFAVYFFMVSNTIGLAITLLLAGFTWPALMYFGAALLVFPKRTNGEMHPAPLRLNHAVAFLVAVFYLWSARHYFLMHISEATAPKPTGWTQIMRSVIRPVLPVTLALHTAFIYVVIAYLLNTNEWHVPNFFKDRRKLRRTIWGLCLAVGLFVIVHFALQAILKPANTGLTGAGLWKSIVLVNAARPLGFIVAHSVFFGALVPFALAFGFRLLENTRILGLGAIIYACAMFLLGLHTESRLSVTFLPFLAMLTTQCIDENPHKRLCFWLTLALSIVSSRVLFTLNRDQFMLASQTHGIWMTPTWYMIQGGLVLPICGFLYLLLRYPATSNPIPAENQPLAQAPSGA